jgi:hypothetical protein
MTETIVAPQPRRFGGGKRKDPELRVRTIHAALLPAQIEKLQKVAEGRDVSFSRVVRDAIALWERSEEGLGDEA